MKCHFCGKQQDDVDSSCKMCTLCGWSTDSDRGDKAEAKKTE